MRRYRQKYPEKMLAYEAKRRATRKGFPCTITYVDVKRLLDAGWECAYCDTPLGSYVGGTRPLSVTLDRVLPELGYVPGNVVLACHTCNSAKSEHTPATLRAWAERIEAVIARLERN
jgi:hypothetical protein